MRVIHTTADFDYCENLRFSENALDSALAKLGCTAECFMSDEDVAKTASESGSTRAAAICNALLYMAGGQ